MEKILLISQDEKVEMRLRELLGSPRFVARISDWTEAHRVMTRDTPSLVIVGPSMVGPTQASELVRLNNLLSKESKKALLLSSPGDQQLGQWGAMFPSILAVVEQPSSPGQWKELLQTIRPFLPAENSGNGSEGSNSTGNLPTLELLIRVPQLSRGKLEALPLTRILYLLSIQKATGLLHLKSGNVQRRFGFHNGHFTEGPEGESPDLLLSAFAWPQGEFAFENRKVISGTISPSVSIIHQGLTTYRAQRQVMDALMPKMATYPTRTQLWASRSTKLNWPILSKFLAGSNGDSTLEQILSSMGRDVNEAFRAAIYAGDTDLVVFREQKTSAMIQIQYDFAAHASADHTPNRPAEAQESKASRATGDDRAALERELKIYLKRMKNMSPHEVFGVWEGCGREVVKETFYRMVKEHHPDVYGGNVSGEVKSLAQKIFVNIRKAYAELIKVEDKQTCAPPNDEEVPGQPTPERKVLTTLRPGSFSAKEVVQTAQAQQRPLRTSHQTSPIGMSREPTDIHPDLKTLGHQKAKVETPIPSSSLEESTRAGLKKPSEPRTMSRPSQASASMPKRTSSAVSIPPRRNSSPGLGDVSSDPDWRREQLERLERKATRSRRPTPISKGADTIPPPTDPAQISFNRGYSLFKQDLWDEALTHFRKANATEGENGLYLTFYAYTLFLTDESKHQEAKELLRKAIETGNRQAMPDAHLFLGKILKIKGHEDRAYKHFKATLELNPTSRDAEREVRLYERRHQSPEKRNSSGGDSPGEGFFKRLFKK